MGCDIHCYVAKRVKDNNGYHYEAAPIYRKQRKNWLDDDSEMVYNLCDIDVGRDYQLFGVLAGVRYLGFEQIADARGFDEFCPEEIRAQYEEFSEDYHDVSFYNMNEIKEAIKDKKRYPKWNTYDTEDEDGNLVEVKDKNDPGPHQSLKWFYKHVMEFANQAWYFVEPEDVRVYFWFDN